MQIEEIRNSIDNNKKTIFFIPIIGLIFFYLFFIKLTRNLPNEQKRAPIMSYWDLYSPALVHPRSIHFALAYVLFPISFEYYCKWRLDEIEYRKWKIKGYKSFIDYKLAVQNGSDFID